MKSENETGIGDLGREYAGNEVMSIMDNRAESDLAVEFEQLKKIEELLPDTKKTIAEKVGAFVEKSGVSPYTHRNEGYAVIARMTGEIDATEAILDYIRKRTEL